MAASQKKTLPSTYSLVREGLYLKPGEPIPDGLRRILNGEILTALNYASSPEEEIHKGIHELRKAIKRIRAVWRLMEPDIGEYTIHREVLRYRDIGRRVSLLRTLYVNLETVKKLRTQLPKKLAGTPLDSIAALIEKRYQEVLKKKIQNKGTLEFVRQEITGAQANISLLPVLHDDAFIIEKSIRKSFRKCRKRWRKVARKANFINMHELRKQIKTLQFQLQVLLPRAPQKLARPVEQLQKLARLSGDEHDLYELNLFIKKYLRDEPSKKELMFRISKNALKLRKKFLPAARKFFGIKSKKFIAGLQLKDTLSAPPSGL